MDDDDYDPYAGMPQPEIYWCLHCSRTYRNGQFRQVGQRRLCPYRDCDGSVLADGMDWESIREHHLDYPVVPEPDIRYVH